MELVYERRRISDRRRSPERSPPPTEESNQGPRAFSSDDLTEFLKTSSMRAKEIAGEAEKVGLPEKDGGRLTLMTVIIIQYHKKFPEEAMALKKSELYSSIWKSCDELRGGMDASQWPIFYTDIMMIISGICWVG
ncbi:MAG: hypothetical protein WCB46_01825 [Methanoregula sp.]